MSSGIVEEIQQLISEKDSAEVGRTVHHIAMVELMNEQVTWFACGDCLKIGVVRPKAASGGIVIESQRESEDKPWYGQAHYFDDWYPAWRDLVIPDDRIVTAVERKLKNLAAAVKRFIEQKQRGA